MNSYYYYYLIHLSVVDDLTYTITNWIECVREDLHNCLYRGPMFDVNSTLNILQCTVYTRARTHLDIRT